MFDQAIASTFETSQVARTSFQGTNALALAFIKRLATDDAFRDETVSDPVAAAAKYGFTVDRRKLPETGITLPKKEVLTEHLEVIAQQFAASASVVVVFHI